MSNDNEDESISNPEPSPFAGRESDPNKQIEITEFSTWYSQIFLNKPHSYPDHPISYAENDNTTTVKYFIIYIKPKQDYIDFIEGVQEYVCFWIKNFFVLKEGFEELEKYIKSLFSSITSPKLIFPLFRGDIQDIQSFRQAKIKKGQIESKEKKRFVFHYIAHQTENTPLDGIEFLNCNCFPLKDLLEISGESSLFIFDRDRAASLYPIFQEYAKSKELENHLVAFFACGANELLPRSPDYPVDLFTSCFNSPARVALVWHSRQYFCFQSGSLQPLSLMFVEEMETFDGSNTNSNLPNGQKQRIKALLDDLTSDLRSTVEAISLHTMNPYLFVKFFRTDKVLSKLTVSFIFACRILSIFNVHPVSYPRIPDMNNASEWHTFALRLDAALYILNHPEEDGSSCILSHHNFLSQVLQNFQNKIDIKPSNFNSNSKLRITANIPFELSFFKDIIKDAQLREPALKTLAKYLDTSPTSIACALYFPIPKALLKLLIKNGQNIPSKYLIFSLVKILAYYKPARSLVLRMKMNYQNLTKKVLVESLKNSLSGVNELRLQSSCDSMLKSTSIQPLLPSTFVNDATIDSKANSQISSSNSFSLNSNKSVVSPNPSVDLCDNSISCQNETKSSSDDLPIISHLLMILFALVMKDSFKLFKEIVITQDIFTQAAIDKLDLDSKIWLLFIITMAADATKDYQILKKLLSLITRVINSEAPKQTQSQILQLSNQSRSEPPPELHAPIVCALSSLIKGKRLIMRSTQNVVQMREVVENNAAKLAYVYLESSLVNVRIELFVLTKKFVEANPEIFSDQRSDDDLLGSSSKSSDSLGTSQEDADTELLYENARLCLKQSSVDPVDVVRNATESTLFSSFVWALLGPIRKMLFGPFSLDDVMKDPFEFDSRFVLFPAAADSTASKFEREKNSMQPSASNQSIAASQRHTPSQRVIRQVRRTSQGQNIMKPLTVNSSYVHNCPITSKLIFMPDQKVAFGDSNGFLNIKDWESGLKYQILPQKVKEPSLELRSKAKISPWSLIDIELYENGSLNPLLFSVDSNTDHHCRVSSVMSEFHMETKAAFPLFADNRITLDKKNGNLYSFAFDEGRICRIRDLHVDQFLTPIYPKFGPMKEVLPISHFNDVVALCSDGFECFDLRGSTKEPVISVSSDFIEKTVSLRIIDESIPVFALALMGHIAVNLDLRHTNWMQSISVDCMCPDEKRLTCGFDFCKKSLMAAVGTEHGVTCIQMKRHYQINVANKKNGARIEKPTSLLFHPDKYELAFVCNNDSIITAI